MMQSAENLVDPSVIYAWATLSLFHAYFVCRWFVFSYIELSWSAIFICYKINGANLPMSAHIRWCVNTFDSLYDPFECIMYLIAMFYFLFVSFLYTTGTVDTSCFYQWLPLNRFVRVAILSNITGWSDKKWNQLDL